MDMKEALERIAECQEIQAVPSADGWKTFSVRWTWRKESDPPPEKELADKLKQNGFVRIVAVVPIRLSPGTDGYLDEVEVLVVGY